MRKAEFIKSNRKEIDEVIRKAGYMGSLNDTDRADWIANHEGLYRWARASGVRI